MLDNAMSMLTPAPPLPPTVRDGSSLKTSLSSDTTDAPRLIKTLQDVSHILVAKDYMSKQFDEASHCPPHFSCPSNILCACVVAVPYAR